MRFERFRQDKDNLIFGQVGLEVEDIVQSQMVRELSDAQLLTALCEARSGTRYRIALESELRRREAWASPSRYALIFSVLAFLFAVAAFVVSIGAVDLDGMRAVFDGLI